MLIPVINGKLLQHEVPQSQEEQSILLTIKSDLWKKICTQIMGASSKTTKIKLQHRRGHRSRRVDHPIHTWLTTVQWSSPVAEPWINDWWVGFSWSYHVDFCYSTISCVYIDNLHIFSKIKDTLKDVNQIFIYIYTNILYVYVCTAHVASWCHEGSFMTSIQTISQCLGNSGAKCMRQCLSNGVVSNCSKLWRVFGLRKQTSACLPVILKSPAVCMLKEKRSVDNGKE